MKKNWGYNFINLAVIVATVLWFLYVYKDFVFVGDILSFIIIELMAVILVHTVKAVRLYLAVYGSGISIRAYIKTYCKITPVSIVLPFKVGEFFRMYCYGKEIGNVLRGIIVILLDRFMDTLALVTLIFMVWVLDGGTLIPLVYLFVLLLLVIIVSYFVFPGMYHFWKRYLLRSRATEKKNMVLVTLERAHLIYQEIEEGVKGKGVILYILSLIAWGIEIGGLLLVTNIIGTESLNSIVSEYLTSAINGHMTYELQFFVLISIILLLVVYVVMKLYEMRIELKGKEVR